MADVGRCTSCNERIDATHRMACAVGFGEVTRDQTQLANGHEQEACRSCKAPIVWAVSVKGKPIPLDAEPVPGGNLVLEEGAGGELEARSPQLTDPAEAPHYISHFATCPDAERWRRGG